MNRKSPPTLSVAIFLVLSSCTFVRATLELPQGSHILIYFNGMPEDGSPIVSNRESQPSARYIVKERNGSVTHLFLDAGTRESLFRKNREIDLRSLELPSGERRPDFLIISHSHTILRPAAFEEYIERRGLSDRKKKPPRPLFPEKGDGGVRPLLRENPSLKIYTPALKNFTYDMLPPVWEEEKLLERAIRLKEGYHPLTERVGIMTVRFREPEKAYSEFLGYKDALENILVVSTKGGYLLHSVCAHMPASRVNGRVPHPAEAIRRYMPDPLPERPVLMLLTGGCDFEEIAAGNRQGPGRAPSHIYSLLKENFPEMERLVHIHCGLYFGSLPECRRVLGGGRCEEGLPGMVIGIPD